MYKLYVNMETTSPILRYVDYVITLKSDVPLLSVAARLVWKQWDVTLDRTHEFEYPASGKTEIFHLVSFAWDLLT